MRVFNSLFAAIALLSTGCATTSTPKDLGKLEYTGFSTKADGSAYQSVMGLNCPSEINGLRRTATKVYNDGGTDVGCNYSSENEGLTIYFSRFLDDNLSNNFRNSQYNLESRFKPQGYAFDEDLSGSCSAQSLDDTALLSSMTDILRGKSEITIATTPSAVYVNAEDGKMTLVVVDEMFEKEFFKTRYTGPFSAAEDVNQICKITRANYIEMKASISKVRGLEVTGPDKNR